MFCRSDNINDTLYVVTPIFNPQRFRSRWSLYKKFEKYVKDSGATLVTIEVAFGNREFVITESNNPYHIQTRTNSEIWLKENAINLAVSRLPQDWKYVAWIDADVVFVRPDWVGETLHQLQHYPVVQMWSTLHDLNDKYDLVGTARSFSDTYINNNSEFNFNKKYSYGKDLGAPGLAWAMNREVWDQLGGLIDWSILGAGDWYMAHALIGTLDKVIKHTKYHPSYSSKFIDWQERVKRAKWNGNFVCKHLGVVSGIVNHFWHGPKSLRQYGTRDKILVKYQYNPDKHLMRDWQGLYKLSDHSDDLRKAISEYFRQRNEDHLFVP